MPNDGSMPITSRDRYDPLCLLVNLQQKLELKQSHFCRGRCLSYLAVNVTLMACSLFVIKNLFEFMNPPVWSHTKAWPSFSSMDACQNSAELDGFRMNSCCSRSCPTRHVPKSSASLVTTSSGARILALIGTCCSPLPAYSTAIESSSIIFLDSEKSIWRMKSALNLKRTSTLSFSFGFRVCRGVWLTKPWK